MSSGCSLPDPHQLAVGAGGEPSCDHELDLTMGLLVVQLGGDLPGEGAEADLVAVQLGARHAGELQQLLDHQSHPLGG